MDPQDPQFPPKLNAIKNQVVGMTSHKMSIIEFFGHKHFKQKISTKFNV